MAGTFLHCSNHCQYFSHLSLIILFLFPSFVCLVLTSSPFCLPPLRLSFLLYLMTLSLILPSWVIHTSSTGHSFPHWLMGFIPPPSKKHIPVVLGLYGKAGISWLLLDPYCFIQEEPVYSLEPAKTSGIRNAFSFHFEGKQLKRPGILPPLTNILAFQISTLPLDPAAQQMCYHISQCLPSLCNLIGHLYWRGWLTSKNGWEMTFHTAIIYFWKGKAKSEGLTKLFDHLSFWLPNNHQYPFHKPIYS